MQSLYAFAALAALLIGTLWYQNEMLDAERTKVASLETLLAQKQSDAMKLTLEKSECMRAIKMQNESLVAIEAEYEARMQEIKKRPERVRYEVVYRDIPNLEVESDECQDIKALLDAVRSSGF